MGDDIASCSLARISLLRDDYAKLLRLNKSFWLIMMIVMTIMMMMRMISDFGSQLLLRLGKSLEMILFCVVICCS